MRKGGKTISTPQSYAETPLLRVRTAFEGHYFIGLLVSVYSLRELSIKQRFEIELEIAVSNSKPDHFLIDLISSGLEDMGVNYSFSFKEVEGGRVRHVSKISKTKIAFLETSQLPFLWLDADTLCQPGESPFLSELVNKKKAAAVPRNGNVENFNSGVFWSGTSRLIIDKSEFPESNFYSDQHILQHILRGSISSLPPEYNTTVIWAGNTVLVEKPQILHFIGEYKPWMVPVGSEKRCLRIGCDFSPWFIYEEQMINEFQNEEWITKYQDHRNAIVNAPLKFSSRLTRAARQLIRYKLLFNMVNTAVKLSVFFVPSSRARAVIRYSLHPFH